MGALLAVLFVWCGIGGLVGVAIGSNKGRSTEGFWLGFLLGVIGWIIVAVMEPGDAVREQRNRELAAVIGAGHPSDANPERRPCPWCAELILPAAVVCRYCGRDVPTAEPTAATTPTSAFTKEPGWYPHPDYEGQDCLWDGESWTTHRRWSR